MLVETSIAPLSPAQMKKLHSGKPVRVRYGNGVKVMVMPMQHKKLMRAHMKGKGMVLTIPPMVGTGNLTSVAKDSAKTLITAGTDRAVQAIEGSGMKPKLVRKSIGGNVIATAKDSAKQLITAGTDRAVRAIEGSGSRDFNAKEAFNQLMEGRPFKKKDGSAPMSMQSISAGKPLGGKIGRINKFNKVFKAVGRKFLPINKNLKPIKDAASARAAQYITEYNNPEAVAQSGLDMFQQEMPQTLKALKSQKQKETPVVYAEPVPYSSVPSVPSSYLAFPSVPTQEELGYEPVKWYGSGVKKGSPEMKARMAKLRAMKGKKGGALMPAGMGVPPQVKDTIRKKVDKGLSMVGLGKPAKGSPEMKAKMAALRARKGKKGGALYPAGYSRETV